MSSGGGGSNPRKTSSGNRNRKDGQPSQRTSTSSTGTGKKGGGRSQQQPQRQRQQTPQQQQPKQMQTFKRNGEKGAETHTVSEAVRIRFTKLMLDLRENDNIDKVEMPPNLSNTERKFLHELASQLGLKSKSSGKGEDRRITITKKVSNNNDGSENEEEDLNLPILTMGKLALRELSSYLSAFPPTLIEQAEANETGSSLLMKCSSKSQGEKRGEVGKYDDEGGDEIILDALNGMKIGGETKHPKMKVQHRHKVNLKKRESSHQVLQRERKRHENYKQMQQFRKKLPAHAYQNVICDTIRNNTGTLLIVVLIS